MPFQPPEWMTVPELILVFGYDGSGKSRTWADWRAMYETTNTPGHFRILNTEPGRRAEMMAQAFRSGEPGKNFDSNATIYEATNWTELTEQSDLILKEAQPEDVLVVDSIGFGWEWAQDDYIQQEKKKSRVQFFADGGGKLNWQYINDEYRSWYNGLINGFPGHRLFIARAEPIKKAERAGDWATSREVLQLFERHGHYPTGQKHNSYSTPTRIRMEELAYGEYVFTILKDQPGRERAERAPMMSFPISYLMGCAGWTITE